MQEKKIGGIAGVSSIFIIVLATIPQAMAQDGKGSPTENAIDLLQAASIFKQADGVPGLNCASGEERHWTRRAYGTRQEVPT